MKNITKKVLYTLAASALVVSCAKDATVEDISQDLSSSDEISFTAAITSRVSDTSFDLNDAIEVVAFDGSGQYEEVATYTYNGSKFTSDTPFKLTTETPMLSFQAMYPNLDFLRTEKFAVSADQTDTTDTTNDLMYASVDATSSTSPTLVFDHILSKVVVNFTHDYVDVTSTAVELYDLYTAVDNSADQPYSDAATIKMGANTTTSFSAIVIPQTVVGDSETKFGAISIDDNTFYLSLSEGTTFEGSKQYELNATIENGVISFDNMVVVEWVDTTIYPSTLEFTEESVTLSADDADTTDLNDILNVGQGTIYSNLVWTSSNEDAVTVADGVITAVEGGEATITVQSYGESVTETIDVIVTRAVTSLTLSASSLTLGDTNTSELSVASYSPSTAYPVPTEFTWESGDDEIATIVDGVVTGVDYGTTTITAKTADGAEGTCSVEVKAIVLGTYYTSDKTFSNDSTTDNIIGLVYYIDEENETAKVVSLEESDSLVFASNTNATTFISSAASFRDSGIKLLYWIANDTKSDGTSDLSDVCSTITNYPILNWGHSLNEGAEFSTTTYYDGAQNLWFVPSIDEMGELYAGISGMKLVDLLYDADATPTSSYTTSTGYTTSYYDDSAVIYNDEDTEISYYQWLPGWYDAKTGDAVGWNGSQTRVGVAMPKTATTTAATARTAFNKKITDVSGTAIGEKVYFTAKESGYNAIMTTDFANYATNAISSSANKFNTYLPARAIMNVSTATTQE